MNTMKKRSALMASLAITLLVIACSEDAPTGPEPPSSPLFSNSSGSGGGTLYAGTDQEDFSGILPDRLAVIQVNGANVISTNIVNTTFNFNGLAPTGTGTLFSGDPLSRAHNEMSTGGVLISSIIGPLDPDCCNEDVGFDGTDVWRVDWPEGPLFRFRPGDGSVVSAHPLTQGVGVTFVGSTLWVTRWSPRQVGEYDPTTNTFTPKFSTTGLAGGLAYDAGNNILWVGETGGVVGAWTLNTSPPTLIPGSTFQPFGPLGNTVDGLAFIPRVEIRMTGGGSFFDAAGGPRFTHGFELHCDANQGPNNLEINWPKATGKGSNRFHLETLTSAFCHNDPTIDERPPVAGFDTYVGSGTGQLNGVSGSTIDFTFTDAGEPGKGVDLATIDIDGGTFVVSGTLDRGNHQAHKN